MVYTSDSTNIIALLGCGCSVATEPVADISHRWNITQVGIIELICKHTRKVYAVTISFHMQISYASASSALSNRAQFKNYFRTVPSFKGIAPAMVSILRKYNWKRILFLTQNENLFTTVNSTHG